MRALNVICLGFLLVSSDFWRPLEAQEPAPRNQLTLDASLFAGGLSYARVTSSNKIVGVGAGFGLEFNIRLVLGENGGKKSTEIAHVEMFTRLQPPGRWQYDLGVKAAADIHSAQVASEADIGGFLGPTSRRCGVGVISVSGLDFRRERTGRLVARRSESSLRR